MGDAVTLKDDVRTLMVEQLTASGQVLSAEALDAIWFGLPDDAAALAAVADRVRWQWWDGSSPVNGVPADVVTADYDIRGTAYLVFIDNVLVYFQTHDPSQAGMVALDQAHPEVPQAAVDAVTQDLAKAAIQEAAAAAVSQVLVQKQEREGNVVVTDEPPASLRPGTRRAPTVVRNSRDVRRSRAWE